MRFTNTSATTIANLLIALRNHLSANGWTILADNTGLATPVLEVTNSLGDSFRLTTSTAARTDVVSGGFTDRNLDISYQRSNIGLSAGYATAVSTNDMVAPYSSLWFISDDAATYCHIIAQVGTSRYSHASFGNIDSRGMHSAKISYVIGNFWEYWRNNANPGTTSPVGSASRLNDPANSVHLQGHVFNSRYRIGLPAGLLNSSLSFSSVAVDGANVRLLSAFPYSGSIWGSNAPARFLDYFPNVTNKSHTGGVNITPLPVCPYDLSNSNAAYVGDLPGIGLVNIRGLSPGQVLTFGSEEWIVFPYKQSGSFAASVIGSNPVNAPNSVFYGLAYRKA